MYYACSQILLRAYYCPTTPVPPQAWAKWTETKPGPAWPLPPPPHPMLTSTRCVRRSGVRAPPRRGARAPGFASGPGPVGLSGVRARPWGLVWARGLGFGSAARVGGLPPRPRPWLPLRPGRAAPGRGGAGGTGVGRGCAPGGVSVGRPVHRLFVIIFSIL
jgi:hypothetical protein